VYNMMLNQHNLVHTSMVGFVLMDFTILLSVYRAFLLHFLDKFIQIFHFFSFVLFQE